MEGGAQRERGKGGREGLRHRQTHRQTETEKESAKGKIISLH